MASCSTTHRRTAAVSALGVAVVSFLAIPGRLEADEPLGGDYKGSSHKLVIITEGALKPRTVTLEEGQLLAWINYSQRASTIVFDREVGKSMICHSLVNFSMQKGEIRSTPLQNGEFASFCELKPGRYAYRVVRDIPQDPNQPALPDEWLEGAARTYGEIVVGTPDS